MARSLDAILQELNAGYDPGRQLINQKLAELPGQADAEISGLNAQKDVAFNDILGGARERGLGFAGIPIAEQAKYASTNFLPAVARVRSSQNDVRSSLLGALSDANLDQQKSAQSIYQTELDRDFQAAEAEKQRAAARASEAAQSKLYSSLYGGSTGAAPAPAAAAANPTSKVSLQSFLAQKYAAQPQAPRLLQDTWVKQWAASTGKKPTDPAVWAAYNSLYPWEQFNDNAIKSKQSINWGAAAKQTKNSVVQPNRGGLSLGNLTKNLQFFSGR